MGWIGNDEHEGHLVAVRAVDGVWEDFERYSTDLRDLDEARGGALMRRRAAWSLTARPVGHVQAVCSCGWRSPRFLSLGATWSPSTVDAPPLVEEDGLALWREHLEAEAGRAN
jgi:hypothetical protein